MREMRQGGLAPDLFLFLIKALYHVKTSGRHLSFNMTGRPRLGHTTKTNFVTFQTVDPEMLNFVFF